MKTRNVTYIAVCAALGAIAVLVAAYTPANVVTLIFYSAAVYISMYIMGGWGILTAAVSLLISFFAAGGFVDTFVLTLVLFTPYALIAYLMRKIKYTGSRKWLVLRLAVMLAFFVAEGFIMLVLTKYLTGVDISAIATRLGGWAIVVIFALISLPTDFFFVFATDKLLSVMKKRASADGEKEDKED